MGTLEARYADRVRDFRARAEALDARGRQALAAGDRDLAAALAREAREVTDAETAYVLETMPFIREYSSTTSVPPRAAHAPPPPKGRGSLEGFVAVTHTSKRHNVLQRYLLRVENHVDADTVAAVTAHEAESSDRHPRDGEYFCQRCDAGMDFHARESMLVCPECGACKAYTEMSANNLTYEQETQQDVVTYFAYKRLNHFCEWLNSLQAKASRVRAGVGPAWGRRACKEKNVGATHSIMSLAWIMLAILLSWAGFWFVDRRSRGGAVVSVGRVENDDDDDDPVARRDDDDMPSTMPSSMPSTMPSTAGMGRPSSARDAMRPEPQPAPIVPDVGAPLLL